MVIFNSYVKLPEGTVYDKVTNLFDLFGLGWYFMIIPKTFLLSGAWLSADLCSSMPITLHQSLLAQWSSLKLENSPFL